MIDGTTQLLAIVGDPIAQVRTPSAINARLSRAGHNAVLVPWHAPAGELDAVMAGLVRDVAGCRVKLPGAGGGAIAHALAGAGAAAISVHDTDRGRCAALAQEVARHHPGCAVMAGDARLGNADLLVDATPVGLNPDDGLPIPLDVLSAATTVVDIVTRADGTALLAQAREHGRPHLGGAAMADGQAEALLGFFGFGGRA